jgi:hypothetical protein
VAKAAACVHFFHPDFDEMAGLRAASFFTPSEKMLQHSGNGHFENGMTQRLD